ncbi:metal-dependent transcriptional regulator [Corynebacterium glucuronolyticum]|uniref:Diphtheria toxin repressor n=2 Tax=Corynebacterium glucuronolyticum TaxID=39791 RepID=A0AAX1L6K9_9CORY|nr:metal-dependent transcriptional regulator [Corynebacterium glucuronolyticum]EEI62274.1 iron dependent repressor DNA binding domain protein [Corynebacterium glucuronolyticum ATCC 51866]QRP69875.1 metal-dependent transcriptional regulator [Corynebacterium glucuronolyticum]
MHPLDLPVRSQDYLKAIYDHEERSSTPATLTKVAEVVGQKPSTASEAIKRLASIGLVNHERYQGITLTEEGSRIALAMARRHRILETFLVETLGYTWDEVHEEADVLEHAVSDRFLERLDAQLGYPTHDPHGDPIPAADGTIAQTATVPLSRVAPGTGIRIARIGDSDPELLRYLAEQNILPGHIIDMPEPPVAGIAHVLVDGAAVAVAEAALGEIFVSAGEAES